MTKSKIEKNEFFVTLKDGQEIFCLNYRPEGFLKKKKQKTVVIVHGLGEHIARYDDFARFLAQHSYQVYLYDQRGHGRTPGIRSYAESFQTLVDDLDFFIKYCQEQNPKSDFYLMGHSFGGQVSINYLAQHAKTVKAAILSSPNVKLAFELPLIKRVLGPFFAKIIPTLQVANDVNPKDLSHDKKVVKDYAEDPLVQSKVSLCLGSGIIDNVNSIMGLAAKIKVPTYVFHGELDKVTSREGTEEFYGKMAVKDRKLKIYTGFFHETLNEIGKEEVYQDILNWLEGH